MQELRDKLANLQALQNRGHDLVDADTVLRDASIAVVVACADAVLAMGAQVEALVEHGLPTDKLDEMAATMRAARDAFGAHDEQLGTLAKKVQRLEDDRTPQDPPQPTGQTSPGDSATTEPAAAGSDDRAGAPGELPGTRMGG